MNDLKMYIGRPAAWIEVTGEDSFPFLQGQCTNDLKNPAPQPVTYTLWLDRKGKVLADSFILQAAEDRFFLYSYFSPAETLIDRLEAFIIADDVDLRDLTQTTASATLWGDGLDEALLHAGLKRPAPGNFLHSDQRFLLQGRRSRSPHVDLVVTGDDSEETMAALSASVTNAGGLLVDDAALERERIVGCIPAVPRDVGPKDLPQEARLENDALSYTKGCYLGQEVMARIRSMGQVRRTLAQVRLDDGGVELPAPLFDGSREVGSLRSVTEPDPRLGLALVRIDSIDKTNKLSLSSNGPANVQLLDVTNK